MTTYPARSETDRTSPNFTTACFAVHADADPGLMPRILEIFAKRGLVPTRWHSSVGGPAGELTIDVEMAGLDDVLTGCVAAEMRAVWGVGLVLASRKRVV
jgi:hypothetical protein